jgi:D-alanyl-D-alanine dipeptidase
MVVFECPLTPQEIEMAAECVTDQWALFASYVSAPSTHEQGQKISTEERRNTQKKMATCNEMQCNASERSLLEWPVDYATI